MVEWDRARKWEMLRRDGQSLSTLSHHLSSSFSSFAFCCFVDVVVVVVLLLTSLAISSRMGLSQEVEDAQER